MEVVHLPLQIAEVFDVKGIIAPRDTRPLLCDWIHTAYVLLPQQLNKQSFIMRF